MGLATKSVDFMRAAGNVLHNDQVIFQYAFGCYIRQDLSWSPNTAVPSPEISIHSMLALAFCDVQSALIPNRVAQLTTFTHYGCVTLLIVNPISLIDLPFTTTGAQDSNNWQFQSIASG